MKLPKIGSVKMRLSRPIPDGFELKQVRIVRRASGWYAMLSLQCDVNVPSPMPHGHSLGIDLGLLSFLATSDSETIARPKFFVDERVAGGIIPPAISHAQRKLKLLQKRVSRKVKGSSNWRKAQAKVAKFHEHISNTRKDFHFKTAHHLCNSSGMIFAVSEAVASLRASDLNLKAMSRGWKYFGERNSSQKLPMLCKHTLDAGFGRRVCGGIIPPQNAFQFLNILEWVCSKRDVLFLKVDANGTSQICPNCQTHTGKKELSQRIHECQLCKYKTDRDVAAAQIVMQRGILAVGQTVLKLAEGKDISFPATQESPSFRKTSVARLS